jgi:hypothetical protein
VCCVLRRGRVKGAAITRITGDGDLCPDSRRFKECFSGSMQACLNAWTLRAAQLPQLIGPELRLAPTRPSKGSCTLNLEDEDVLYSLQQRPLNGSLNLENAAGSSICRVSLNGSLSI